MVTLYPSPQTRRRIEEAIGQGKVILWIYDSQRSLFFNPAITSGAIAGAKSTPSDGGTFFNPDFIVRGGCDGFAAAARTAGVYEGSGLSSEFEDCAAAQIFFAGARFTRDRIYMGS